MIEEWRSWKLATSGELHLSNDALHVLAGLTLFVLVCLVFRWRPSDWRPWTIVFMAECFNEAMDMIGMLEDDGVIYVLACVKDLVTTMLPPTILSIVARHSAIFGAPKADSGDEPEVPGAAPSGERDVI